MEGVTTINNAVYLWDPLDDSGLSADTYQLNNQDLFDKLQNYRLHPHFLRNLLIWGSLPLIILLIFLLIHGFESTLFGISFIPLIFYYSSVKRTQDEILLCLVCDKNHWLYNPLSDSERIDDFVQSIPQVFDYGHSRELTDQIWGNVLNHEQPESFWTGSYTYVIGSGRSSQTYHEYIFIFKLHGVAPTNFSLVKPGLLSRFEHSLKTESDNFNHRFHIEGDDETIFTGTKIIQTLSPSVQTRLLDFTDKYPAKRIMFDGNLLVLVLDHKLWQTQYTNFFKQVTIDERDENNIFAALVEMSQLPSEIVQFIESP